MKLCLVVDDSSVIRKVARCILEKFELRTREAADGQQALAHCARSMPDAILFDSGMPDIGALEFIRRLRRMPGGRAVRIVLSMTEYDADQISQVLRQGADDILLKPFDTGLMQIRFQNVGVI